LRFLDDGENETENETRTTLNLQRKNPTGVSDHSPNLQQPWNNWYHLMGHTYGTWLPGDPRGLRTGHPYCLRSARLFHRIICTEHFPDQAHAKAFRGLFPLIGAACGTTLPQMTRAWNNWYHVTAHVYGSWLHGDPRGWRARHHRDHVEGDYKNPPPAGKYDRLFAYSKSLMQREPVHIEREMRKFVVDAIADRLRRNGIEVLIASVDEKHLHLLGRFSDHQPSHWVGLAKKHVSHLLRQDGLREDAGGLWAKGGRAEPIKDRQHQLNSFRYILAHGAHGAALWRFDAASAPSNP